MIDTLYAWLGKDTLDGTWGIVTIVLQGVPLAAVSSDRVLLEKMAPLLEHSIGHTDLHLVEFIRGEVIQSLRESAM